MEIEWVQTNSKPYLKFTFNEYLEEEEALEGIDVWVHEFGKKPNAKIPLIWDCTVMKGYDRQARIHWQKKTKELKDQIDIIWLISNSLLIRTGADIISMFARIKIKPVNTLDKIT